MCAGHQVLEEGNYNIALTVAQASHQHWNYSFVLIQIEQKIHMSNSCIVYCQLKNEISQVYLSRYSAV
jgi:hypothetical protein